LINACENKEIDGRIEVVISDKKDAFALERAKKHNISAVFVDPKKYVDKDAYEEKLIEIFNEHEIGLICLAGFMRIVGHKLVTTYHNKIMNIHPSLLPSFPGLYGQRQAVEYGVKYSGATVHFVDGGCDTGPIITQTVVPVYHDDTEESLTPRILEKEHEIYAEAVQLFAQGKLKVEGRIVVIS
jgi:phosphoribosylglycinamide formyltransferase-1